jgi:hypothetical protein
MLSGEGMEEGTEDKYAAFAFWKTENKVDADLVRKKPQS